MTSNVLGIMSIYQSWFVKCIASLRTHNRKMSSIHLPRNCRPRRVASCKPIR